MKRFFSLHTSLLLAGTLAAGAETGGQAARVPASSREVSSEKNRFIVFRLLIWFLPFGSHGAGRPGVAADVPENESRPERYGAFLPA